MKRRTGIAPGVFVGRNGGLGPCVVCLAALLLPSAVVGAPIAYVANSLSGTVSVIDTAVNAVVATIPLGATPRKLAITPDGRFVYCATRLPAGVTVIDALSRTVSGTIAGVGAQPEAVAIGPDGHRVYVTSFGDNAVSVIDTLTNTVEVGGIGVGTGPGSVAVAPDGRRAYVANSGAGTVSVINLDANAGPVHAVVDTIGVGASPASVAVTPSNSFVYVANFESGTVSVIDAASRAVVATVAVGASPSAVAIGDVPGRGVLAYVANFADNSVAVLDADPSGAGFNTVVATIAAVGSLPASLALTPAGDRVYVTNFVVASDGTAAGGFASIIETAVDEAAPGSIPAGKFPIGIALGLLPPSPTRAPSPTQNATGTPTLTSTPSSTGTPTAPATPTSTPTATSTPGLGLGVSVSSTSVPCGGTGSVSVTVDTVPNGTTSFSFDLGYGPGIAILEVAPGSFVADCIMTGYGTHVDILCLSGRGGGGVLADIAFQSIGVAGVTALTLTQCEIDGLPCASTRGGGITVESCTYYPTSTPAAAPTHSPTATRTTTATTGPTGSPTRTPTPSPTGTAAPATPEECPLGSGVFCAALTYCVRSPGCHLLGCPAADACCAPGLPCAAVPSTPTATSTSSVTPTPTPSVLPSPTITPTPTATPSVVAPRCPGDCDGNGAVAIDDLVVMVGIALGERPAADCVPGDGNGDGAITVDEILVVVARALEGCPTRGLAGLGSLAGQEIDLGGPPLSTLREWGSANPVRSPPARPLLRRWAAHDRLNPPVDEIHPIDGPGRYVVQPGGSL